MCPLSFKKFTTQLYISSGMFNLASFVVIVEWRTVSKTLEKSRDIIVTLSFVSSSWVMFCMIDITAAVVDPVGLKANWSANRSLVGSMLKAGYMYLRTKSFSTTLDITGVIDIGLYSAGLSDCGILA